MRDHAAMSYEPAEHRYDAMPYRRCGRSGLQLPAISLGLWNNFGDDCPLERQREILRRAFDLGVCHFDLANNYGPPPGSAEINFGRILREDLAYLPIFQYVIPEGTTAGLENYKQNAFVVSNQWNIYEWYWSA